MGKNKYGLNEWILCLLIAMATAGFMFVFCWPVRVEGVSMQDTFNPGDRLLMSRLSALRGYKTGDIVICRIIQSNKKKNAVKRIIAAPGDSLVIENGLVYLNGNLLDEDYIKHVHTPGNISLTLNEGEYFVMGDNRQDSYDSRAFGVVNKNDISGKIFLQWYPFAEMRAFL